MSCRATGSQDGQEEARSDVRWMDISRDGEMARLPGEHSMIWSTSGSTERTQEVSRDGHIRIPLECSQTNAQLA